MVDHQSLVDSAFTAGLMSFLSAQPLYELCREQIHDVCYLIEQCCLRVRDNSDGLDPSSLCIKTTMHEETIFQYASTDTRARLAHWVRQYSGCETASDRDAHAAYIMACAVKALGALNDWMRTTDQKAWSHLSEPPTDWPWELYCQFVEMQANPNERIEALDQYVLHLEPITSLPCLIDDELTPVTDRAIKNAVRKKGGINSGMERNKDISARDTAIVRQAERLRAKGMKERDIPSAVHAWLVREVAKPPKERPEWIALETQKALTRKSVEAILKRNFVL
ncbi:hypothetical protein [Pseudomonas chlororaphis]|uniref:hypothetical protein n=1 Tax=Pseudomonas chlororaphis TaxID=587753 RepID=UPI001B3176B7|nr:hypothetical protein [Pseudomonas chlororaphis]MBP5057416.1 hypothetical protein [Pseudomonas chlororaphis]MBP5144084.1 hypothetical protein [Pseudomonas chlororaphis]QTU01692.1 hypothetical protein HUT26_21175 [Pseudomonas chlororaphis]